ncbi:RidA family protein [Pseudonocardia sichuanensis]|uniref:2-iminobutanoate/2-iminopropanoate deaminase n=1 Tax=Pseudonocardia kunmingensis TaxID=630975 RepID=A0A543DQN7_9PSEU|nr:RidA family protein [Pseudonocardia kunmingensis]TQM11609.1 2-iminobutanoate/2-iminopropanoate deaminase [Pseudonocardia kunmingensis]
MRTNIDIGTAKGAYTSLVIAGDIGFVAGQGGLDESSSVVPGGIEAETATALGNLERVLAEVDATLADVVSMTCYLADLDDWAAMDAAYRRYFGDRALPARTAVGVAALPFGLRVEITATAYLPGGRGGGRLR